MLLGGLRDDVAPRVDHMGAAPEVQPALRPDPVHEHDEQLEHAAVEAGDAAPVAL